MNSQNSDPHIELFQKKFLLSQTHHALQHTEQNLLNLSHPFGSVIESIMTDNPDDEPPAQPVQLPAGPQEVQLDFVVEKLTQVRRSPSRLYSFKFKYYALEVVLAYALTVGLLYLSRAVPFPFFECLVAVVMTSTLGPFACTHLLALLPVPMAVANYQLQVWLLTYPEIILCYMAAFIFTKNRWNTLLWVVNACVVALFGYVLLVQMGRALGSRRIFIEYYVYPWLLMLVRTGTGLVNYWVRLPNLFVLQVPFFLSGLGYGYLLTLNIGSVQFWYLIIFLTLDIVNTRYQFLLRIAARALKLDLMHVMEARCSGYACMHSFHLVGFVYLVCYQGLNSAPFRYDLAGYINDWNKPLVVWIFFLVYEFISLIKLKKKQNLMLIGSRQEGVQGSVIGALGLSCGLWFFYLGLCIPSTIFFP